MDKENKSKTGIILDAVCGIIMLSCILSYAIIGLVKQVWHPTWIIIVAGGFVCGIIGIISDTITRLNVKDKENSQE